MQSEEWVETDVNVASGVVEFSEPLTVEELEASRDQVLAHLNNSYVAYSFVNPATGCISNSPTLVLSISNSRYVVSGRKKGRRERGRDKRCRYWLESGGL
jgi:hypothetical protein